MLTRISESTSVLLAPNAGPMTLEGTNTYVIAAPGSPRVVVVDPGPDDRDHVDRLASIGPIELVLITHRHDDHTGAIDAVVARTGAPVRAIDPAHCRGAAPLVAGETIEAAGHRIRVLPTPGHTVDSTSFHLPDDGPHGSVLTGDTILGRGTPILSEEDGALAPYVRSLWALRVLGPATVLPGHGPALPDLVAVCDAYLHHRAESLRAFTSSLARLELPGLPPDGGSVPADESTVSSVTDALYAGVNRRMRVIAETHVRTHLEYLAAQDLTTSVAASPSSTASPGR